MIFHVVVFMDNPVSCIIDVVLEELWTFVLGTKQSIRITSVQFHSFGSRIYLVHFNVSRKPGLAEAETLNLGSSKLNTLVSVC